MIGRDVEPGHLAIDPKQIIFWRGVFPTHFTGTPKVCHARLYAHGAVVLGIALQKSRLQGLGRTVTMLHAANRLSIGGFLGCARGRGEPAYRESHYRYFQSRPATFRDACPRL